MDFFRELDSNNLGYLTHESFSEYFKEDEDFIDFDFLNLVKYWSGNDQDRLTFVCLKDGLSPSGSTGRSSMGGGSSSLYSRKNPDQKASQDRSWRKQLKFVIYLVGKVAKGQELEQVLTTEEAQDLWQEIDNYRYGYVSSSLLSRWLADAADFNLPFDETHYLYNCFEANELQGRIDEN